jgi:hypothetical protein
VVASEAKPEVGERMLAVEISNEPRHLATADVEEVCRSAAYLAKLYATCLPTPAPVERREDTLVVELSYLIDLLMEPTSHALSKSRIAFAIVSSQVQLPGAGASANANSISGCAHSVCLKSPRSQAG